MGLKSSLFRGDPKLEAALVSDPAHIIPGASGIHVGKIQLALVQLDQASIESTEVTAKRYGPSTAGAVLAYKKKRKILNRAYQTQPDNIVGKMTMASLDSEMATLEQSAKGAGKLVKKYKSLVSLTHRPTLAGVQARNGLPADESAQLCLDWLRAELARRELLAGQDPIAADYTETVVRKYTLRPNSVAKDQRTGVSMGALKDLWNGALDEFLHAYLETQAVRS